MRTEKSIEIRGSLVGKGISSGLSLRMSFLNCYLFSVFLILYLINLIDWVFWTLHYFFFLSYFLYVILKAGELPNKRPQNRETLGHRGEFGQFGCIPHWPAFWPPRTWYKVTRPRNVFFLTLRPRNVVYRKLKNLWKCLYW